jgi:uncharacterized protein (TIGR02996 family)
MIENEALVSAIGADPDDDGLRLVYADWLEEHGHSDRARLIRVQIELARLPDNAEAAAALQIEEEQLEAACEEALPHLEGIAWGGFERGLVSSVCAATPADFRRHARSIAAVGLVHRVRFDKPGGFAVLAEVPAFARITDLTVDCDRPGFRDGDGSHRLNDDLHILLESAHCPRLRSLRLDSCDLGPCGAKAVAECPRMDSLIELDLGDNYIGDEGMAVLAASPYLSALRFLRINMNNIGPPGVEALADSVSLGGLEVLKLGEAGGDVIGPAAGVALGQSPYLTHLRELQLHDDIGALGAAALAQSPNLAGLTELDLCTARGPDAARALAASPYLYRLTSLSLRSCEIGDEGAGDLAQSPILANVEYLDLSDNDLTDEGARALASSPYLTRLKPGLLVLRHRNSLTEDGWQVLRARFGDAVD